MARHSTNQPKSIQGLVPLTIRRQWRRRLLDGCAATALLLGLALPNQADAQYTTIITSQGSTVLVNEGVLNSLGPPIMGTGGAVQQNVYQPVPVNVGRVQGAYNYGFAGPVPVVPIGGYDYGGTIIARPQVAQGYGAAGGYARPTYSGPAYQYGQAVAAAPTNLLPASGSGAPLLAPPSQAPRSQLMVPAPPRSQSVASLDKPKRRASATASTSKSKKKSASKPSSTAKPRAGAMIAESPAQPAQPPFTQVLPPSDALLFPPTGSASNEAPAPGEVQVAQIEAGVLVDLPIDVGAQAAETISGQGTVSGLDALSSAEAPSPVPTPVEVPSVQVVQQQATPQTAEPLVRPTTQVAKETARQAEPLVRPTTSLATSPTREVLPTLQQAPLSTEPSVLLPGSREVVETDMAPAPVGPTEPTVSPKATQQAEALPQSSTISQEPLATSLVPTPAPMPPIGGEVASRVEQQAPAQVGTTFGHTTTGVTSGPRDLSAIPAPQPMPRSDQSLPMGDAAEGQQSVELPQAQAMPQPQQAASQTVPDEDRAAPEEAGPDAPPAADPAPAGEATEGPAAQQDVAPLVFSNEPPALPRRGGDTGISLRSFEIDARPEASLSTQVATATAPDVTPAPAPSAPASPTILQQPATSSGSIPLTSSTGPTTSGSPVPAPTEPSPAPTATLPAVTPQERTTGRTTGFDSSPTALLPQPQPMPSATAPRATTAGTPTVRTLGESPGASPAVPKPQPWPTAEPSSAPAPVIAQQQPATSGSAPAAAPVLPRATPRDVATAAPVQSAALPPQAVQSGGEVSVLFAGGSADVQEPYKPALQQLAFQMVSDPSMRIRLVAYAQDSDGGEGRARRLSLSRALAVRSYLMLQGVQSTRMDVRALGNRSTGGPADRVDIVPAS